MKDDLLRHMITFVSESNVKVGYTEVTLRSEHDKEYLYKLPFELGLIEIKDEFLFHGIPSTANFRSSGHIGHLDYGGVIIRRGSKEVASFEGKDFYLLEAIRERQREIEEGPYPSVRDSIISGIKNFGG